MSATPHSTDPDLLAWIGDKVRARVIATRNVGYTAVAMSDFKHITGSFLGRRRRQRAVWDELELLVDEGTLRPALAGRYEFVETGGDESEDTEGTDD